MDFYSDFYRDYSFRIEVIAGKGKTTILIKPRKGLKHNLEASVDDAKEVLKDFGIQFDNATEELKSTETYVRINRGVQARLLYFIRQVLIPQFKSKGIIEDALIGDYAVHYDLHSRNYIAEIYQHQLIFKNYNAYIKLYYPTNPLAIASYDFSYHPKLEVKISKSKTYKSIEELNALSRGLLNYILLNAKIKPSYFVKDEVTSHDYFTDKSYYLALLKVVEEAIA